jgi:hypothetical protein
VTSSASLRIARASELPAWAATTLIVFVIVVFGLIWYFEGKFSGREDDDDPCDSCRRLKAERRALEPRKQKPKQGKPRRKGDEP